MTTIIENTDSGSSAVGLIVGILLAVALVVGGLYFYNAGGMTHTETNTTILPAPTAPAPAPQINITPAPAAPAPAAPAAPAEAQ